VYSTSGYSSPFSLQLPQAVPLLGNSQIYSVPEEQTVQFVAAPFVLYVGAVGQFILQCSLCQRFAIFIVVPADGHL
jgi:hypothetical protein